MTHRRQWQILGIAHEATPPHATLNYGANATYSLLYNLYADRLLNLGLVPQSVYNMQSNYYPQVQLPYGIFLPHLPPRSKPRHPFTNHSTSPQACPSTPATPTPNWTGRCSAPPSPKKPQGRISSTKS
ncbi:MAG: glutaminase domain-containing protein [Janthinobacterium lividum]